MGLTRCIMTDYVVSFNLVNCPSKTFSLSSICTLSSVFLLSFVYPSIPLPFLLSTTYYVLYIPSGGVSPTPHALGLTF